MGALAKALPAAGTQSHSLQAHAVSDSLSALHRWGATTCLCTRRKSSTRRRARTCFCLSTSAPVRARLEPPPPCRATPSPRATARGHAHTRISSHSRTRTCTLTSARQAPVLRRVGCATAAESVGLAQASVPWPCHVERTAQAAHPAAPGPSLVQRTHVALRCSMLQHVVLCCNMLCRPRILRDRRLRRRTGSAVLPLCGRRSPAARRRTGALRVGFCIRPIERRLGDSGRAFSQGLLGRAWARRRARRRDARRARRRSARSGGCGRDTQRAAAAHAQCRLLPDGSVSVAATPSVLPPPLMRSPTGDSGPSSARRRTACDGTGGFPGLLCGTAMSQIFRLNL